MAHFISFIHVLCGVSFLGLMIASFVYVMSSIRQRDPALLRYALKISLRGDYLIFMMILVQFLTGTWMVIYHHLSFQTPWIVIAYTLFGIVSVLWFMLFLIKYHHYQKTTNAIFSYRKIFVMGNVLIILLFCFIIHDAVTQQTWFWR